MLSPTEQERPSCHQLGDVPQLSSTSFKQFGAQAFWTCRHSWAASAPDSIICDVAELGGLRRGVGDEPAMGDASLEGLGGGWEGSTASNLWKNRFNSVVSCRSPPITGTAALPSVAPI